MYNRYIPQPDGSFRRKQVSDMQANSAKPMTPKSPPNQQPQRQEPVPASVSNRPRNGQPSPAYRPAHNTSSPPRRQDHRQFTPPSVPVGSFFRQLLPKDFCTEDLIVVLLLLLMAGDSQKDQNSALLTLALYLFL